MRKEVRIGIFAVVMIAVLYWGINFIKGTDLVRGTHTYYALYDQVSGLQTSAPIVVQGFQVGVIKSMDFDPEKSSQITLELSVKAKFRIPRDSRARIFSDGLLGGKAIAIELGSSTSYLEQGDTLHSGIEPGLLDVAGSELEDIKQQVGVLIAQTTRALEGVNTLLELNTASLTTTLENVASISGTLDGVVARQGANVEAILRNINALTASLGASVPKLDRAMGNVEAMTDTLRRANLSGTIQSLSSSLAQLDVLIAGLNRGQGTAGKLLTDQALYDSLAEASANLSALLEDLKANPKRYLHFSLF